MATNCFRLNDLFSTLILSTAQCQFSYFLSLSFEFKSNGNVKKNSQNTEISNFVSSRVLRKLKVYNLPENIFQNMDSLKIL